MHLTKQSGTLWIGLGIVTLVWAACVRPAQKSGTVLWEYTIGGEIWSPLREADKILYFGCDDSSFYAFDIESKNVRWKFKTDGIIRSAADISNGLVVFASDDGFLYALDAEKGTQQWKFDLGSSNIPRRLPAMNPPFAYDYKHSSPVSDGGRIFVGSANGTLFAIDQKSGEEIWQAKTDGSIRSTPAVGENNVFVGSWDGKLYAFETMSGEKTWEFDTGGIIQSSPALGGGMVFTGSRSAKIFALDERTGEKRWEYVHGDGSWVESSPVYRDGNIYIGSSDGQKLQAFNAATGDTLWQFRTGGWSWSTPVVTDKQVYIGSIGAYPYPVTLRGGFYAVNRRRGTQVWSAATDSVAGFITGGVFSSPVIIEGVVYVGSLDGILRAIME